MIEVMIQTFSRAVVPSSDVKGVAVLLFQFLWKGREGKAHHIGSTAGGGMTEETYVSVVKLPIRSCSEDESQKGSHQQLRSRVIRQCKLLRYFPRTPFSTILLNSIR